MKSDISFPLLNRSDEQKLTEALHYLNMSELRDTVQKLDLPIKGKKALLIAAIMYFIQTGKIKKRLEMPAASRAGKGSIHPIAVDVKMLYGAYKNDEQTRMFFKKIIGDYFHFTAFGIDWLQERWMGGNPPTYGEFAHFWKKEYVLRKNIKSPLKREWAYLSFIRAYTEKNPEATKTEVLSAWEKQRGEKVQEASKILSTVWERV